MLAHDIPGKDEEQEGDDEVGDDDVDPHVEGERVHEGEKLRRLLLWLPGIKIYEMRPFLWP